MTQKDLEHFGMHNTAPGLKIFNRHCLFTSTRIIRYAYKVCVNGTSCKIKAYKIDVITVGGCALAFPYPNSA